MPTVREMGTKRAFGPRSRPKRKTSTLPATQRRANGVLPFARAASTLRTLGVVENLRLLLLLFSGPKSVNELAIATAKSNYLVARRLAKLSRAGLVVAGSRARYELRGERSRRLVGIALKRLRAQV